MTETARMRRKRLADQDRVRAEEAGQAPAERVLNHRAVVDPTEPDNAVPSRVVMDGTDFKARMRGTAIHWIRFAHMHKDDPHRSKEALARLAAVNSSILTRLGSGPVIQPERVGGGVLGKAIETWESQD